MKSILITGCNGLLGQTLLCLLSNADKNWNIIGVSRGKNRTGRSDFVYENIDITDKVSLTKVVQKHKPDVIINTAAMTNVDICEDKKEECFEINVNAVKYLINLCKQYDSYFIHISTDFIFDGKKGYYSEEDKPNPLSYYGWSKLQAEKIIVESGIKSAILRTILVYGKVHNMARNNIVLWIKDRLENQQGITVVDDQYRMPTYVEDLANACLICIDQKVNGIYNVSSNQLLSIYEIAKTIASVFNLDDSLIKPISTQELGQKAKRPPKTGFDLSRTSKVLQIEPYTFEEDLRRFKQFLT